MGQGIGLISGYVLIALNNTRNSAITRGARGSMTKLKGGIASDRERFSELARKLFDVAVAHRRLLLPLPEDAIEGGRFNSDEDVFARIESMFTEEDFLMFPGTRIDAALIDAGQADFWYRYECSYKWMDEEALCETEIAEGEDNG